MLESAVNSLGTNVDPWGYVLLFALCLLEASAFIGLFVPGETALLLAGVLANQGKLSLVGCLAAGVTGAILGDSLGYELGRHFGSRLRSSWFGQKVGDERWQKAHDYVQRTGGRAVFFGRWIGVLRALVPAVVGDARMSYKRFLFWNVLGAVASAPTVVLLGYAAGSSYRAVERRLGQVSYALIAVLAVLFVVRFVRERQRPATD